MFLYTPMVSDSVCVCVYICVCVCVLWPVGEDMNLRRVQLRSLFSLAPLLTFPEDDQITLLSLPSSLSVSTPSLFLLLPWRIPLPFPFVGSGLLKNYLSRLAVRPE